MVDNHTLHRISKTVSSILSDYWNTAIQVKMSHVSGKPGSRNFVYRANLKAFSDEVPDSVAIKISREECGDIWDEWAALAFLNQTSAKCRIPDFYGGSLQDRFVIMEDFGRNGGTLREVLNSDDFALAEKSLIDLMATVGIIQASTFGKRNHYQEIRNPLGKIGAKPYQTYQIIPRLLRLKDILTQIGLVFPNEAEADLKRVVAELTETEDFYVYTHGDIAPSNFVSFGGRMLAYDFGMGDFRHALIDGVYPNIRYLAAQDAGKIPESTKHKMCQVYREELAKGCPAANDDTKFDRGLVSAAAGWMASRVFFLPKLLDEDHLIKVITGRQQVYACLNEFVQLSKQLDLFHGLLSVTEQILSFVGSVWDNQIKEIPYIPAFSKQQEK